MSAYIDHTLFPIPGRHSAVSTDLVIPRAHPGVSLSSTNALQEILTDNHKRWHGYWSDEILDNHHNHAAHSLLSLWSLGANSAILRASYADHSTHLKPAFESPSPIIAATWKDHLGDMSYYTSYLRFFKNELETKSFSTVLEEYIFSPSANFIECADNQPEMVSRFLDELLHGMIHIGLGAEFGMPGILAEGLAQILTHGKHSAPSVPARWFNAPDDFSNSQLEKSVSIADSKPKEDVHAFTVLARVIADPELSDCKPPPSKGYWKAVMEYCGEKVAKYVDQWTLDGDLDRKVHELLWLNTVIYGVGGTATKDQFKADFFLMHLVTSSIFLPSLYTRLSRPSQVVLLRSYLSASLSWHIARGRRTLDLASFFTNPDTLYPTAPAWSKSVLPSAANPPPSSPESVTPNNWISVIQSTLVHPDDHLCKLQRALSVYALHFGLTPADTFKDTELKGAEYIDGTLFIRTAGLTLSALGWVREGQDRGYFDLTGFVP